jgi:hypothetical protein
MRHPFNGLEFISVELKWIPKTTGDREVDYAYGYECAYRYSEALLSALNSGHYPALMKMNDIFRASIDIAKPAGEGFQDGILGR